MKGIHWPPVDAQQLIAPRILLEMLEGVPERGIHDHWFFAHWSSSSLPPGLAF
jgi:hypothetical protein